MKYFKDILELILECLLFYEKIKIQGITCKKIWILSRIWYIITIGYRHNFADYDTGVMKQKG